MSIVHILSEIRNLVATQEKITLIEAMFKVCDEYGSSLNKSFQLLRESVGLPVKYEEGKPFQHFSSWQEKKTKQDFLDLLDKTLTKAKNEVLQSPEL